MTTKLLTYKDVAGICGVKVDTIYKWVKDGKFPKPMQLAGGKSRRWTKEDIDKWIEQQPRKEYDDGVGIIIDEYA